ncbi:hypothetical protein F5B21DRAFT_523442 [Xylaria acuta]|nr:hypothetical protein F5B21DRAFT_523442 [Xylaria acuta]
MPCDDNITAASSPPPTEQEQIKAIMASLPPTEAQDLTSAPHAEADAHNTSILAVRGFRTTATGNELFNLADLALLNHEIPATLHTDSIATQDTGAVDDAAATTTSAIAGETLPVVTTFEPFYFFFYGSLQIPDVLQGVCEIDDKDSITLRKNASINGWKYKMWGPYPALVPAAADDEEGRVGGTVWLCEKPEHVARLCNYETSAYRMAYCDVLVPSVEGSCQEIIKNARTFVNNQNSDELTEGSFDVEGYYRDLLQLW